ncbi:MAG: AAA family ATPase [Xanthobacteraceae bacterium]|nr:AAA family ATPase [Xanthobacteraceae bacterium]
MTIADKEPAPVVNPAPAVIITRGSELKSKPIQWLWPNRIARGKLTLLAGAPGTGKSALATTIMAAVTTGGAFPCDEGHAAHGSALMVCPHADPDVLLPRLKAARADLARVQLIRDVPGPKGQRPFDVATDLPLLDAAIRNIKDLRVIIIDGFTLPTRRAAAEQARITLKSLVALAECHAVSIMLVMKPAGGDRFNNKPASFHPLALEAARAAFMIETDPADEKRRLLQQIKNECAPDRGMLAFRITPHQTEPGQTAARIAFEPQHHPLSVRQFRLRQARSFNSAKAEAVEFVRGLFGGARELKIAHVEQQARAAGLLRPTQTLFQSRLLREARMALEVVITREGSGGDGWVWAKPAANVASPPVQATQPSTRQPALNAA